MLHDLAPATRTLPALLVTLACAAGCAGIHGEPSQPPAPEVVFGEMTDLAGDRTDKGLAEHHFTEVYEHFLLSLRNEPIRILEIGVAKGGSLGLWRDYFPSARIYGIDIYPKTEFDTDRVTTFVADQANREQLAAFIEAHGGEFDFILDDGGHTMEQQQVSFGFFFPYVKPGGYYILEDVQTSLPRYYTGYGAEPGGANTTLGMIDFYIRTSLFKSEYMTPEEQAYLTENVEFMNLFFRNTPQHSMTCIFKKRSPEASD